MVQLSGQQILQLEVFKAGDMFQAYLLQYLTPLQNKDQHNC